MLTVYSQEYSAVYGTSVTYGVTIGNADTDASNLQQPAGTITLLDGTTPVGTITIGSQMTTTTSLTPGGNQYIKAVYNGYSDYTSQTALTPQPEIITKANSSVVSLTNTPNSSNYGQNVTYSATVQGVQGVTGISIPQGAVTFFVAGVALPPANVNASGVASLTTSLTPGGADQSVTATYNGDLNYYSSSSSNPTLNYQTVNTVATSASVTNTPSNTTFGDMVTLAATVTGVSTGNYPGGWVDFTAGTQDLGLALLNDGVAELETWGIDAGNDQTITATYEGDGNYTRSETLQNVAKASPNVTLSSAPTHTTYGATVDYTAVITSEAYDNNGIAPGGNVDFKAGSLDLGAEPVENVDGVLEAVLQTGATPGGIDQTISAKYEVDDNYNSETGLTIQTVTRTTTSTSVTVAPNPFVYGQPITYTVTVTGVTGVTGVSAPSGTVSFAIESTVVGQSNTVFGQATLGTNGTVVFTTQMTPAAPSSGGVYAVRDFF